MVWWRTAHLAAGMLWSVGSNAGRRRTPSTRLRRATLAPAAEWPTAPRRSAADASAPSPDGSPLAPAAEWRWWFAATISPGAFVMHRLVARRALLARSAAVLVAVPILARDGQLVVAKHGSHKPATQQAFRLVTGCAATGGCACHACQPHAA